jgi:para-aminobenzoate synthetase/4-amino-4-deoxychorismate lyase
MSLSPEMFLKSNGTTITVKPMKGTLFRDGSLWNNLTGKHWLHRDPKNRAENIMICDLLRNDLGRICHTGTVKATKIYEVAKYRTVYQMTSTVEGELMDNVSLYDLFSAVFPSGSVTGTPKIRAMEIIRDLEEEERRIYTGAIGFISPGGEMFFNVPIRTILLRQEEAEMGIGGGITYYSTPEGEYEECVVKARFLKV